MKNPETNMYNSIASLHKNIIHELPKCVALKELAELNKNEAFVLPEIHSITKLVTCLDLKAIYSTNLLLRHTS